MFEGSPDKRKSLDLERNMHGSPGTRGMWHFRGVERGLQGRKVADKGFMEDEAKGEAGTRLSEPVTLYGGEIICFQEQWETITYRVHFKQGSDIIRVSCLKEYFGCCSSVVKVTCCFSSLVFLTLSFCFCVTAL